jgi:hypothetical protein
VTAPTPDTQSSVRLIAGRYRLRRVLGQGSMDVVWLGYDELLHRQVAIKQVRLHPGLAPPDAAKARQRIMREARAIAALTHPNVVAVFDVATVDAQPYVVMELLPARSLTELVGRHGALTAEQAAQVADAVAAALDTAHRHGIVHRDVKPGNVLVGDDGQVKLTDFGIARNVAEATITDDGIVLGTPAYIAPEVLREDAVTPAADLWALGATLFAAVAGRPPFAGDTPLATVNAVVDGDLPDPGAETPLADIITGLMVRDPAARMSLAEVRRRVHELLPAPGSRIFPVDGSDSTTPRVLPLPHLAPKPAPSAESGAARLAVDPGPLPFAAAPPGARPVRRARRLPTALTAVLAVLVFLAASAGGFTSARLIGRQPVLPVTGTPPSAGGQPPGQVTQLARRSGLAASGNAVPGAAFSIDVPQGWTVFVEPMNATRLPPSTVVRYVKPDGTTELTVQRFGDFYTEHSADDYLAALRRTWSAGYVPLRLSDQPSGALPGGGPPMEIGYRTVDTAGAGTTNSGWAGGRTTYAELLSHGNDLWVLSLTVPTVQEGSGAIDLFDRIKTTFLLTG